MTAKIRIYNYLVYNTTLHKKQLPKEAVFFTQIINRCLIIGACPQILQVSRPYGYYSLQEQTSPKLRAETRTQYLSQGN